MSAWPVNVSSQATVFVLVLNHCHFIANLERHYSAAMRSHSPPAKINDFKSSNENTSTKVTFRDFVYLVNKSVLFSSLYTARSVLAKTMDASRYINTASRIEVPHANIDGQDGSSAARPWTAVDHHGRFVLFGLALSSFQQQSDYSFAVRRYSCGRPRAVPQMGDFAH